MRGWPWSPATEPLHHPVARVAAVCGCRGPASRLAGIPEVPALTPAALAHACARLSRARILRRVVAVRVDITPFARGGRADVVVEQVLALPAGPVKGLGRDVFVVAPATVRIDLRGTARRIDVHVTCRLDLRCPCDRCLEPVLVPVAVDYGEEWRSRLATGGLASGPSHSADEADDPDDERVVRREVSGPSVDCEDGFWQNVGFALPAKLLCAPGCRGLCPRCGADLNHGPCGCRETVGDPRLAALAAWRQPPRGATEVGRHGPRSRR